MTVVKAAEIIVSPDERFVIFTQYRETLEFLREELGRLYGPEKIATIKGGPLEDKITAVEQFWDPDGARFLVSTSAGGEGINLQVCHVLFNYDLPWNPMAIEQRIGRIHRYGQQDTVQVYSLVAEDTVEQRIYDLLEEKLLDIARTIGKVDPVTGSVIEDFRGDILGFLGSSPNYQELYKKAVLDRDYRRTADEMAQMIEAAAKASQALQSLAQDLTAFNLEHYRRLQGEMSLDDLRFFMERAIIRLGGSFIPDGDLYRIEPPAVLRSHRNVAARYDAACFRRDVAMRRRSADLMGIGHPLVDAVLSHFSHSSRAGDVTVLPADSRGPACWVRYIVEATMEDGSVRKRYESAKVRLDHSWQAATPKEDLALLTSATASPQAARHAVNVDDLRARVETALADAEARARGEHDNVQSVRSALVGLAFCG